MTATAAQPAVARPQGAGKRIRLDLQLIAEQVPAGARVLDVGCGDGTLLEYLTRTKGVDGRGIEIDRDRVAACLNQGLSVIQGDAEVDLADYPDAAFDIVVLSQTLQAVHDPKWMLEQLLRVGSRAVVSITNAGYWKNRVQFMFAGRQPFAIHSDETWFDTAYIHPCTMRDFVDLARLMNVRMERCYALSRKGAYRKVDPESWSASVFAAQVVFVLA